MWDRDVDVFAFAQELAGGRLEDLFALDGGVKMPVEVFPGRGNSRGLK